jgi:hypothetical protein
MARYGRLGSSRTHGCREGFRPVCPSYHCISGAQIGMEPGLSSGFAPRACTPALLRRQRTLLRDEEAIHPNRSYESYFFTTSNPGGKAPDVGTDAPPLISATDIGELKKMDIIVTCQGGDYTNDVHPKLRAEGWPGYWIDAASALRSGHYFQHPHLHRQRPWGPIEWHSPRSVQHEGGRDHRPRPGEPRQH